MYVEYRSMGESPDISGAWNVAVRERERESGGAGTGPGLVGWAAWSGTVRQFTGIESCKR